MATVAVTQDTFENEVIEHVDTLVLVDFWAEWCGPCKSIAPVLEEVSESMADTVKVCKVDVDTNNELAARYNVRGIPTLLLFKNGQQVETKVGAVGKDVIVQMVENYVDKV